MPEEKNYYQKSSGSSDGQSKAESDFANLHSEEHRKGALKADLFPGSKATFRILEVLHCRANMGRGNHFKMYIHITLLTIQIFLRGKWLWFKIFKNLSVLISNLRAVLSTSKVLALISISDCYYLFSGGTEMWNIICWSGV